MKHPYEYQGYDLEVCEFDLTEKQKKLLDATIYIVENYSIIRDSAEKYGVTKSWLHRHIHEELPFLSTELYWMALKQIQYNTEYRKVGGKYFKNEKQKISS